MQSPDPFVPDPADTQSFNRYAYVLNNPLVYTDPSGFKMACANGSASAGGGEHPNCVNAAARQHNTDVIPAGDDGVVRATVPVTPARAPQRREVNGSGTAVLGMAMVGSGSLTSNARIERGGTATRSVGASTLRGGALEIGLGVLWIITQNMKLDPRWSAHGLHAEMLRGDEGEVESLTGDTGAEPESNEKPSLVEPDRAKHILDGDGTGRGRPPRGDREARQE